MDTDAFRAELARDGSLREAVARYAFALSAMAMQLAACNALHLLQSRLARWLLTTQDRAGSERFPLTQQFLSFMLGVRRPMSAPYGACSSFVPASTRRPRRDLRPEYGIGRPSARQSHHGRWDTKKVSESTDHQAARDTEVVRRRELWRLHGPTRVVIAVLHAHLRVLELRVSYEPESLKNIVGRAFGSERTLLARAASIRNELLTLGWVELGPSGSARPSASTATKQVAAGVSLVATTVAVWCWFRKRRTRRV